MHELSLFGQVPLVRHEQVLNILAGLAAMQPQTMYERHLIFQPIRSLDQNRVNKKNPGKPAQNASLAYVQLVKALSVDDFGKDSPLPTESMDTDQSDHGSGWTMRVQETPEPETKTLVLRKVTVSELTVGASQQYFDSAKHKWVNLFLF